MTRPGARLADPFASFFSRIAPPSVILLAALILGLAGCGREPPAPEAPAPAVEPPARTDNAPGQDAGSRLADLVAEYFEASLIANPVTATSIGDPRYNDRLPNRLDPAWRAARRAEEQAFLDRARAIDRAALTPANQTTYDVFVYGRRTDIERYGFPDHLQPLSQMRSLPNFLALLGSGRSLQPFETAEDYRNWLARLADGLVIMDQMIGNMREGMERGIVQPRVVMEKVVPQLEAHVVERVEDSLFFGPVSAFPEGIGPEDREALETEYRAFIGEQVIPAYRRLFDFVVNAYLPASRDTVARTALPDGEAWYDYLVRSQTTTDLSAEEIHTLGLSEVARILDEMRGVKEQVGFEGDLAAFFEFMATDPRFRFDSEAEALRAYEDIRETVTAALPAVFEIFPRGTYEIRPVEAFRAASAAGASYQDGSPDGSRPGIFYLNTHDLSRIPTYITESLSLHEAEPGHHFQSTIQLELEDLPDFRRFGDYYVAYGEGWALYAEYLGREMGLFTDPYQYYGKLAEEQLRALRLVVDTGLHAKGWTREEAIAYMQENSSMSDAEIVAEVERYIAIPGQALGYKVGQLTILELRAEAEAVLGEDFDLKSFHTALLEDGAVPMEVLRGKIAAWIAARQT